MSTLGSLITRVQQRVRDTGYSSSEITDYLNDTQRDIFNEYQLRFMEATQAYTVTAGVADITNGSGLPTDYVQAIDIMSGGRTIPCLDVRQIDNYYPNPDDAEVHPAGQPLAWYMYANTINLYPVPDAAYDLTLRYYKEPTVLSGSTDVPSIPSEFEELLILGAAYRVMQVKDNYDQAGVLQNKYDEILQKLVVRYSQTQVGTPTIMRSNNRGLGASHF